MDLKTSPLAPPSFPEMPAIDGVHMWVAETGIKYKNRPDVLLVKLDPHSRVAGVFTKSTAPGAPVTWSRDCLKRGANRGILVNAGNANVFTGKQGDDDVRAMAGFAAQALDCDPQDVYVCSTGVIGEPLDLQPFESLATSNSFLSLSADWPQVAQAIATTDTYPKGSTQTCEIDGVPVTICGIAKGSGMIAPDMATMLSYIFTNANIAGDALQEILTDLCALSFNAITVDSDTSTSDTVLLAATAKAANSEIKDAIDPALADFKAALQAVMQDLAHQIVKDGEGASKFIKITVTGALNDGEAKTHAMSIANSPLVKTAIAGEDANWGRIVMAVGKSGAQASRDDLKILFGPHVVAQHGRRAAHYDEDVLSAYMKNDTLDVDVDVGVPGGVGTFTVWTCDLTHGYIDINADYRS